MKKTAKVSGSNDNFKPIFSRKKKRGGVLENGFGSKIVSSKIQNSHSWSSETSNTTESDSINIEEECLVEETSFRQESREESGGVDTDMTPKGLKRIVTKHFLGKLLGIINFGIENNDDDDILDGLLSFPLFFSLKHMVQVLVRKSFALDINLGVVADKSFQEKLAYVRKIFSGVNGFGGRLLLPQNLAMMAVAKLTNDHDIVVNTNLKRPGNNCMNWAIVLKKISVGTSVEAVCMAICGRKRSSNWKIRIKLILARANIDKQLWDVQDNFIGSVGGKTCFIDYNSVNYFHVHCATVCFSSELDLVGAMTATPVIKSALCAVCKGFGHTSLSCWSVKDAVAPGGRKASLSAQNQFKLARIYVKKSVSISCPLAFSVVGAPLVHAFHDASMSLCFNKIGEPLPLVVNNLKSHLVGIESSLVSLAKQIGKLVKRLESLVSAVSQPSPGCQLPITLPSQNQGEDIVMKVGLGEATSDKIVLIVDSTASSHVVKLKKILDGLFRSVLSLSAHFDIILCRGLLHAILEDDIVQWHKDMDNLVLIFMKTKLRNKACSWLVDKFNDVHVFSSGLNSGYMGAGVVIVMNRSLARHVYKVSEVPGCLLCIKLLFKNKLLVSILGLYADASLTTQFSQADEINSLIVKAVNESSFVILGGDFNEDDSHKCTSFKKCHDLDLINSLGGSSFAKAPTWSNSQDVAKTIDYVFVSSNLVNVIIQCDVSVVSDHFDMDHKAVSVSLDLGGLLDNNFKDSILANSTIFSDEFVASVKFSDLDAMWCVVCKVITLSANEVFKKKWFRGFDEVFTKDSSNSVDNVKSFVVQNLVDSGTGSDHICSAFFGARKSYHASKLTESLRAKKANIRSAIDKKMESFEVNKSHTIRSVLKHSFHKVVLNHLVVNDDLILEPDLVKSKVDVIIEGWTKKRHVADDISIDWHHQYQPLEYVFDKAFSGVMCLIGFNEFFRMVSELSDNKSAGLSDILNKLWKHCNKSVLNMLLGVLTNTHPIALIKTAHKILSKILSDRISLACSAFDVFHENNFSVLKSTTIQSPIFVIGSVVEDVLKKNQELWLVLQDMWKAYNSVGWKHLKNNFGLMDDYHVHNSLDQREVFSPLLWQKFYDPLLCEVKHQESINDISINNDKTVAILINSRVSNSSLSISVRVHSDVRFFTNLVLKKAVPDKQFLYLVSAVLHPIVGYRTQFSFVPVGLKLKSGFLLDFPSDTIHHSFFYSLKSFLQCQSEGKILCWQPIHSLVSLVRIRVNVSNNFLADMVHILFDCKLSLGGSLASSFQLHSRVLMSVVLGESLFCKFLSSLWHYGVVFINQFHDCNGGKRLDSYGLVPKWFDLSVVFFETLYSSPLVLAGAGPLDICGSNDFVSICDCLSQVDADSLSVYTDGLLKILDMVGCRAGAAAFFEDINLGLGVSIYGLLLSTLTELQAIVLALECMPVAYSVHLFSDSQMALNTCRSEFDLVCPDFHNQCWIKRRHIRNVIHSKNLRIKWHKVKGHSGISGNDCTNSIANAVSLSNWYLPLRVSEHFLLADDNIVSGNFRHFVHDVFHAVCHAHWEVGSGSGFLDGGLCSDVNWLCFSKVWHPNLHIATGFTSRLTADIRTYFIKALHCQLPMAV
ncbi:hypothetical protein G9A89_019409 [Geosiphon pyriformis]|nr:hypothetical protein G9A89_019409 [Geosiphon pyriformis]